MSDVPLRKMQLEHILRGCTGDEIDFFEDEAYETSDSEIRSDEKGKISVEESEQFDNPVNIMVKMEFDGRQNHVEDPEQCNVYGFSPILNYFAFNLNF